jgi:hypothetical protein
MPPVHVFGIRHHGPGSARSLLHALRALEPDALLIEGPPEADALLPLARLPSMRPPAALLIYAPDEPAWASYYPFAAYSPEWQAILYGLENEIPVGMMDLPQAVQMALAARAARAQPVPQEQAPENEAPGEKQPEGPEAAAAPPTGFDGADPLRLLAEAAGYSESELWWEHLVEQRRDPADLFAAILEAMTALREAALPGTNLPGLQREAAMRQKLRAAVAAGRQRIAVVCGAWHAPALASLDGEKEDAALLKGLPKMAVQATWVPWTNARLTRRSGYGAGIDSPGWYEHLWATEHDVAGRWMIRVARLLRAEDLDVSPAHVVEAVRLAEALAALRDRPLPGLPELNEAALTVYCFGNPAPMQLIEEKLIVGNLLGSVPPETPMAPLQQDFDRTVRRLRMAPEAHEKALDLDLRRRIDLARSHLLHRLRLLDLPWGRSVGAALQAAGQGRGGTFHEVWRLKWQPEYAVLLIEAGQWGNTLAAAAAARATHLAGRAPDLAALTGLVEDVLLADLPEAIRHVMGCLQVQAAVASDIPHLMQALPPLAAVLRYGSVRQTDTRMIAQVVDGLAARICIGLPGACSALNDDAAGDMFEWILNVDEAIYRLADGGYRLQWQRGLLALADAPAIHGLIAGRACRILLDGEALSRDEAARRLRRSLSTAAEPAQAAAWLEGFLRGSGQLLVHDETLLGLIDAWLSGLAGETFPRLLPLLRRTFATFSAPERHSLGERLKRGPTSAAGRAGLHADFDQERASSVLPLIELLLRGKP